MQPHKVRNSSFFINFEESTKCQSKCLLQVNIIKTFFYDFTFYESVGLIVLLSLRNRVGMLFSKEWFSKFMVFFGYLMAIIYIGLGVLLFVPKIYPGIPQNLKFAFALFFFAYGLFRLVKLITKKTEPNE